MRAAKWVPVFALALMAPALAAPQVPQPLTKPAGPSVVTVAPADPGICIIFAFKPGCRDPFRGGAIWQGQAGPLTSAGPANPDLNAVAQNLLTVARLDFTYAAGYAKAANTAPSIARGLCYQAVLDAADAIKNALPAADIVVNDADGKPLAKPDPSAVTDLEIGLEKLEAETLKVQMALDALRPTSDLMRKCTAGAVQTGQGGLQFVNNIMLAAAAIATAPKIPIPGLQ